jgi:hypothetical protein
MMKIKWNRWIVGCCLLGILSKGYAIRWTSEEDGVVIEFVEACTSNPCLTWQDCADAVNQFLEGVRADHRRTAEACRERWDRHLKNSCQSFLQLSKPRNPGKYCWSESENARFMESVREHTNGAQTDWEAVSRDIGDRSAAQCRDHYKVLASHGFSVEEEETSEEEGQNYEFDFFEDF